mmetsp:Transcript_26623/g.39561  ORF Transcript_26623/g.39561 Transcript_26623/m.39561 type:complete len:172 (-) Transcript_26623:1598-2113(-)
MNITGGKGAEEDLSELLENIPSLYGPRSNSSTNIESAINDESTVDSLSTSEHNNGNLGGNLHLKDIYNHTSSYSDGGEEIDPWSKSYVGISSNYFSVGIRIHIYSLSHAGNTQRCVIFPPLRFHRCCHHLLELQNPLWLFVRLRTHSGLLMKALHYIGVGLMRFLSPLPGA